MRMQPIFILIAAISMAMLVYTFSLGWRFHYGKMDQARRAEAGQVVPQAEVDEVGTLVGTHFKWAIFTSIFVCFVHSLVLVYFLGTGKAIKEQVELQNWDDADHKYSLKLMAKAVIPSCAGIVLIIIASFSGAFTLIAMLPPDAHMAIAAFGMFGQLPIYVRQFVIIRENGRLMDRILDRLEGENVRVALTK
jgi:hypothetical protein